MTSCNTGKIKTKKKIIIFSSIGLAIAAATYLAFTTTTNNSATAAAIPALVSFAACPAMCAAIGGGIWLKNRFSKNNNDNNVISIATAKEEPCCGVQPTNKKQQKTNDIEILESKEENAISVSQQKQKIKDRN